jgi:hypothetical protein
MIVALAFQLPVIAQDSRNIIASMVLEIFFASYSRFFLL